MRRCAVCGKITKARKCPEDGFPTLRIVAGSGKEIVPGSTLGGRYRVTDLIGQGGFGKVFGIEDIKTGTKLAVKVLSPVYNAESEEATRRFVREAHITSRLTHGNTIRVLDYGQTQNAQLFLIMERLNGEPLNERLRGLVESGTRMPTEEIITIGIGVLSGLAEAHSHKLVHRDMKPENVFLHRLGKRSIVKVLDFGIVRQAGSEMTMAGQPIGTPTHMSPEQAMGKKDIDARSDLYSLGVCLYECAALRLPIDRGTNALMTMMAHVSQPFLPLSATAPELDADLAAVIEKALAKDRDDRYQSATEMREALRKCEGAKRKRRISQLTVAVDKGAIKPKRKRNVDSHRLLNERRISRLSLTALPPGADKIPPPPPPDVAPGPAQAVQGDSAAVASANKKSGRRGKRSKNLHLATTLTLNKDKVSGSIAAEIARRKKG